MSTVFFWAGINHPRSWTTSPPKSHQNFEQFLQPKTPQDPEDSHLPIALDSFICVEAEVDFHFGKMPGEDAYSERAISKGKTGVSPAKRDGMKLWHLVKKQENEGGGGGEFKSHLERITRWLDVAGS